MKRLSIWSVVFTIIGVLLFGFSYIFPEFIEILMSLGFVILIIGSLLYFGAMLKRETGITKFLSVAAFFILGFIIIWDDPFQIVRLLIWMKN